MCMAAEVDKSFQSNRSLGYPITPTGIQRVNLIDYRQRMS
jgi:hypothetical protein